MKHPQSVHYANSCTTTSAADIPPPFSTAPPRDTHVHCKAKCPPTRRYRNQKNRIPSQETAYASLSQRQKSCPQNFRRPDCDKATACPRRNSSSPDQSCHRDRSPLLQ